MVASKCVVASSSTRARHSSKSALTEEHFMGSASRAVKSRSVLTTGRSMVLDQRRDLQEVPAEELGDGGAEGVVVVAGDHVSGAGYVDGLGVGNQLLELVDGGLGDHVG